MRSATRGFTLIELLIVISILGIMAMIVVPRFVGAANTSRGAAMADQIRVIREQVSLYRAQHQGQWPGIDSTGAISPDADFTATQLTLHTDRNGDVSLTKSDTYCYGPYLPAVPANPISGLKTFAIDTGSGTPTADDSTAWIYQPATGKVWPNCTGSDADGKAYFNY